MITLDLCHLTELGPAVRSCVLITGWDLLSAPAADRPSARSRPHTAPTSICYGTRMSRSSGSAVPVMAAADTEPGAAGPAARWCTSLHTPMMSKALDDLEDG